MKQREEAGSYFSLLKNNRTRVIIFETYGQTDRQTNRGTGSETGKKAGYFISQPSCTLYIHGDSIKSKPNCLCHIFLTPDYISY